eukprot:7749555-Lingulodinium_polyedra.AAC.1
MDAQGRDGWLVESPTSARLSGYLDGEATAARARSRPRYRLPMAGVLHAMGDGGYAGAPQPGRNWGC